MQNSCHHAAHHVACIADLDKPQDKAALDRQISCCRGVQKRHWYSETPCHSVCYAQKSLRLISGTLQLGVILGTILLITVHTRPLLGRSIQWVNVSGFVYWAMDDNAALAAQG